MTVSYSATPRRGRPSPSWLGPEGENALTAVAPPWATVRVRADGVMYNEPRKSDSFRRGFSVVS
jgi:hypothetical protein